MTSAPSHCHRQRSNLCAIRRPVTGLTSTGPNVSLITLDYGRLWEPVTGALDARGERSWPRAKETAGANSRGRIVAIGQILQAVDASRRWFDNAFGVE